MAESLHRIAYDGSIDDAVDVAFRFANRTQAFQKQIRQHVIIANAAVLLIFVAIWTYFGDIQTISQLLLLGLGAAIAGTIGARFLRSEVIKQIHTQHRKVIAEQFSGKPSMLIEVELRSDAVWVRQAGMEMLFPWSVCTGVHDNPDDVEINFSPGICVVRNRNFASPADRQTFLDTAKRLAGSG